jgi:hypothetical protein
MDAGTLSVTVRSNRLLDGSITLQPITGDRHRCDDPRPNSQPAAETTDGDGRETLVAGVGKGHHKAQDAREYNER